MELTGTQVAQPNRMRERSVSTQATSPLLAKQPITESTPPAEERSAPAVEEAVELDKYDISTIACTD